MNSKITYTYTDEAPMLATHSFLPIIRAFAGLAGIEIEISDLSLAGRILAVFPEFLNENQRVENALADLGKRVQKPDANIIKLPNISASVPQLQASVEELQKKGFPIPDYPENPVTEKEKEIQRKYDSIKGSAVNPVLREGNSDRRASESVKAYARKHPHSMGSWSPESKTHVSSMESGDFYESEKSVSVEKETSFQIEFVGTDGTIEILKTAQPLEVGEVIDTAVMSRSALCDFFEKQMEDSKERGVLFSLHLKATMMKVSDPVIFGHAVSVFFKDAFAEHSTLFDEMDFNLNNGLGDLLLKVKSLPENQRKAVEASIQSCFGKRPDLAMVNSDKGITNLHVPSDVIIDASMPAAIRIGGKMWDSQGKERDMKAVIPDRSYAGIYSVVINHCREHGALDPTVMGSVSNVGLMARKAEEYGSHDKTFVSPGNGVIRVVDKSGQVFLEQNVEQSDIFRMCQAKDNAIADWVGLAVQRAKLTKDPAIFWLDESRSHDRVLIGKVKKYLLDYDTTGLDISIMSPDKACARSLERSVRGENTISVTGNVLRDYLTDLFPILELGTSAKMLSIVPLMNGGGLFETGAGGSAPKHVQQLISENHLRWDSLGEFLSLAVSFEHLARTTNNSLAGLLSSTLDKATGMLLENQKSPSRRCGEIDNRGSHYYLARYWAEALALQDESPDMKKQFSSIAKNLAESEQIIVEELLSVQGQPVDIGGYYKADSKKTDSIMRPSRTFNRIIDAI